MKLPILVLFGISLALFACQETPSTPLRTEMTAKFWKADQDPFYHGVASGDPLSNAVIIWTRVTPERDEVVSGKWNVATDDQMQNIVQSGTFETDSNSDYTVKA